jgi:hypothetical protein
MRNVSRCLGDDGLKKGKKSLKIIVYVVSYLHVLGKAMFGGMNIV